MKKLLLLVLIIIYNTAFSQREANVWYFGNKAGIDFNSGHAVALKDGVIDRWEGVASFSDSLGNLLFYTDGSTVWNRNHEIMQNGTGLLGHQSSTESAIIVPYPQHDSLYYIFTVDREGKENGLRYSLVNMKLDNGFGAITEVKNKRLITPVAEKVTAVRHANNQDIWIITHEWKTDSFYVYFINEKGLDTVPLIFEAGSSHLDIGLIGNNAVGYMRAAPTGDKIALALQVSKVFEVFRFDNKTGQISLLAQIPDTAGGAYGVEFSPDGKVLYFTSKFYLYQADLHTENQDSIVNSVTYLGKSPVNHFFGALQLSTEGKIYLAHDSANYLGVINKPLLTSTACDFEINGFFLGNDKHSRMGLPNFIQTYFLPPGFTVKNTCFGDSTIFIPDDAANVDSISWDFGDGHSSKNTMPAHKYKKAGFYSVTLTSYRLGVPYDKKQIIEIFDLPYFYLGNDTLICKGDTIELTANSENTTTKWSTGATNTTINTDTAGIFSATLTDTITHCIYSDTIEIKIMDLPTADLGNDTSFCQFDTILLSTPYNTSYYYKWSVTDTDTNMIKTDSAGTYRIMVTDTAGCVNYDTINVIMNKLPDINLGNDTIICENTTITFDVYNPGYTYHWFNGSDIHYVTIDTAGTYWVVVTDENLCQNSDTINVYQRFLPRINMPNDTTICDTSHIKIKPDIKYAEYIFWNTGETDTTITTENQGIYILKASNICGYASDTIFINTKYCGEFIFPNIITPNKDGINDKFKIKGLYDDTWSIKIFDKWGKLVFYSEKYENNWEAEGLKSGIYYYVLYKNSNKQRFSGFVYVYK